MENFTALADVSGLATALKLNLLNDARRKLDEYFDPHTTRYVLSRTFDPDSGSQGLMLEIHTELNCAEALAALDRFNEDYWLDVMPAEFSIVIRVFPKDVLSDE